MKVIKIFFTILGCAIILLGAYSAVDFMLQRDFAPEEEEVLDVPEEAPVPDESPAEEEVPAEEAETEAPEASRAQELLDGMSQDEKIYQLMFVSPETVTGVETVIQAGDATKAALADYPVGGLYYGQANLESAEQAAELTENTLSFVEENGGIVPFLGIYEDGSYISPVIGYLEGEMLDSFASVGQSGDPAQATALAEELATTLTDYHFNANFASGIELFPVDTSFSTDGNTAAEMSGPYVTGLQGKNVAAVLGHFPGEGSTVNGENSLTREEFLANDILPFTAGIEAGAAIIQVSNMTAPELDTVPCCLSEAVITDLLRTELGYTGVVLTDPLGSATISSQYDPNEAAVMALEAGADMLFGLTDLSAAHESITTALEDGRLTQEELDERVLRILNAKLTLGILE